MSIESIMGGLVEFWDRDISPPVTLASIIGNHFIAEEKVSGNRVCFLLPLGYIFTHH